MVVESPSWDSLETLIKSDKGIINLLVEVFPDLCFCYSYFVLRWHQSPNTQVYKYCSRNHLSYCQGTCCLSRACLIIPGLCSCQKEYKYMHSHFSGILCSQKNTHKIHPISCFWFILDMNGTLLVL